MWLGAWVSQGCPVGGWVGGCKTGCQPADAPLCGRTASPCFAHLVAPAASSSAKETTLTAWLDATPPAAAVRHHRCPLSLGGACARLKGSGDLGRVRARVSGLFSPSTLTNTVSPPSSTSDLRLQSDGGYDTHTSAVGLVVKIAAAWADNRRDPLYNKRL